MTFVNRKPGVLLNLSALGLLLKSFYSFDIMLLNSVGSHLISFMVILSIYLLFKKYLLLLTSNQISLIIFITLNLILYIEILLSYFLNNIYFTISHLFNYLVISIIIFIPIVTILNKLNK